MCSFCKISIKSEYFICSGAHTSPNFLVLSYFNSWQHFLHIYVFFIYFCQMGRWRGHPTWAGQTRKWRTPGNGWMGHPGSTPTGERVSPMAAGMRTVSSWSWKRTRKGASGMTSLVRTQPDTSVPISKVSSIRFCLVFTLYCIYLEKLEKAMLKSSR